MKSKDCRSGHLVKWRMTRTYPEGKIFECVKCKKWFLDLDSVHMKKEKLMR